MSQLPQDLNAGAQGPLGMPSGFFSSLFDMGFTKYITGSVIKFLYWLIVILASLGALAGLLIALASGRAFEIVFGIIFFPIVWLIELILARVGLEIIMIIFRTSDDVRSIRAQGSAAAQAQPPSYGSGYGSPGYGGFGDPGEPGTGQQPPQYPTQQF